MVIDVFGLPGPATSQLEAALAEALEARRLGEAITLRRIEDPGLMIARGVRKPPALAIDGEVVCRGRVPAVGEILGHLDAARA
jgi:Thioredoxin domain